MCLPLCLGARHLDSMTLGSRAQSGSLCQSTTPSGTGRSPSQDGVSALLPSLRNRGYEKHQLNSTCAEVPRIFSYWPTEDALSSDNTKSQPCSAPGNLTHNLDLDLLHDCQEKPKAPEPSCSASLLPLKLEKTRHMLALGTVISQHRTLY